MEIKEIVFSSKEAEKNKEYYEKLVVQTIEESERSGIEIGNGKAANVLSLKQDERLCMKAIYNKDISRNDTHKEMEIMQNLYSKGG